MLDFLEHLYTRITRHIFVEKVNGKVFKAGGLRKHKEDKRDFRYHKLMGWSLFGTPYVPKQQKFELNPISIKTQLHNDCTQESGTGMTEILLGKELSEECLSCEAVAAGVVSGDGLSDLRSIQQVICKQGIADKRFLDNPKGDWAAYSSPNLLTQTIKNSASGNKPQSFFLCSTRDERLKALDDGHPLHIGGDWYSGYNQSGGFASPWLISAPRGVKVGGHAVYISGYDMNYNGQKVYIIRNSYGAAWGDGGKFYMTMDFFDKEWGIAYAQTAIPVDTATFLNNNQYAFVKGSAPGIYMIWGQKKQPFQDWVTFLAYGGTKASIITVDDKILNAVETGEPMDITGSDNWPLLQQLVQPDNYKLVLQNAKLNP